MCSCELSRKQNDVDTEMMAKQANSMVELNANAVVRPIVAPFLLTLPYHLPHPLLYFAPLPHKNVFDSGNRIRWQYFAQLASQRI